MTDETPKKPRRKRRTKAQIAAEKAIEEALNPASDDPKADIPYEPVVRDREAEQARIAEKVEDECIPCQESSMAALEAAESAIEEETFEEAPAKVVLPVIDKAETKPKPKPVPKPRVPKIAGMNGLQKIKQRKEWREQIDKERNE